MRSHGTAVAGIALAAVALALTGCAPDAAAPPALPDGVVVSFLQLRSDVAAHQGQVRVDNGSEQPLEIGQVAVTDPRFDGAATRVIADRTTVLAPGGSVDIRIQLPEMDCAVSDGTMTLRIDDLSGHGREGPLADPLEVIGQLHDRECRLQQFAAAADLGFTGFRPSPAGEPAELDLTITPTGRGGTGTVVGVQRTNLIDFDAETRDGAYPLDLVVDAAGAPVTVTLPIVPFRCDPHAVQEDKRGTIFDIRLDLEGDAGEVELFVGEEMRGHILTWVADWCGFGGG
ncbi:hypothetical protein [Microbacterium terricola]|uniref:Lipoprotein n=1 Tax=Microbacterium terricola TaxID=344163 RepID=A0ABM8E2Z5_9MICO|nr:hypothetical protein [Microbacterium terricola]UYK40156.1 hypothetical protein OAU46_00465 [Microbacterium terricola]BDV32139.1 hypothetical protein Microterr_27990 [Microbacterium terricola]